MKTPTSQRRTGAVISPCGERIAVIEFGTMEGRFCQRIRLLDRNGEYTYGTWENARHPLWKNSEFSFIAGETGSEMVKIIGAENRDIELISIKISDRVTMGEGFLAKVVMERGQENVCHRRGMLARHHELVWFAWEETQRETISNTLPRNLHVLKMLPLGNDVVTVVVRNGEVFDNVENWIGRRENCEWEWTRIETPALASLLAGAPEGDAVLLGWEESRGPWYSNEAWQLWKASVTALSTPIKSSPELDGQIQQAIWHSSGIYLRYARGQREIIALVKDGHVQELIPSNLGVLGEFSISHSGELCFSATDEMGESGLVLLQPGGEPRWIERDVPFELPAAREVSWLAKDGTRIEGVLLPAAESESHDPRPLLVVAHGGPCMNSRLIQSDWDDLFFYPTAELRRMGIHILKPNYRGSDGQGRIFGKMLQGLGEEPFRDCEEGALQMVRDGIADPTRLGFAGWSFGGTLASWAACRSNIFKAISVGASSIDMALYWATSAVGGGFPEQFLNGVPWKNVEGYAASNPAREVVASDGAILIQHGSSDPINHLGHAEMLYRALKDMRDVEYVIFPGAGHGIPCESPTKAEIILQQNQAWFAWFLLGIGNRPRF